MLHLNSRTDCYYTAFLQRWLHSCEQTKDALGNFYVNFVVRGPSCSQVLDFLRQHKRAAYVLEHSADKTVIYDKECDTQDIDSIHALGAAISKDLAADVIGAVNHDDDFLYLGGYR